MFDLDTADECVQKLINILPDLDIGLEIIKQDIQNVYPDFDIELISQLNFNEGYKQFEGWLIGLIRESPIPKSIIAANFGLFENAEEEIQLYISGSTEWEKDDGDWACDNDYFPEGRYADLDLFKHLYEIQYQDDSCVGLYLSLGISILFITTFARHHSKLLLNDGQRKFLILATGYDSGDLYNIGKLNSQDLESIT